MSIQGSILKILTIHTVDNEPRVLDTDLAEQLGFERPRAVRQLIDRHSDLLLGRGNLPHRVAKSGLRGRPAKSFYLNEAQALMICLFCRTERADEVRNQVVDVFMAWRKGALTPVQQPKLPGDYVEALEALLASEKDKRVLEHRVQNLTADAYR